MNRNDFIDIIGSRKSINRNLVAELSELVVIYPYFQTAHKLLLKGLKDNQDIRFENQLRNSAVHVSDREELYKYLMIGGEIETKPGMPDEMKATISLPVEPVVESPVEEETVVHDDAIVRGHESEGQEREPADLSGIPIAQIDSGQTVPDSAGSSEEKIGEIGKVSREESSPELLDEAVPDRPEEIQATFSPSVEPVKESPVEEETVVQDESTVTDHEPESQEKEPADLSGIPISQVDSGQTVLDSARSSEEMIREIEKVSREESGSEASHDAADMSGRPILVSDDIENDGPISGVFLINEGVTNAEESVFYMDPGFSVPDYESAAESYNETITGVDEPDGMARVAMPVPPVITEPEPDAKALTRKTQADLIDKFILADPRIEPRKDKSDQPGEDLSVKSTEEGTGFVTETLARIYINQGYYSKATDIYEKLSLKFPEKSDYFATQIQKIKEFLK